MIRVVFKLIRKRFCPKEDLQGEWVLTRKTTFINGFEHFQNKFISAQY